MCCNQQNKQYCIRNIQYTKEAYLEEKKNILEIIEKDISAIREEFETFKKTQIHQDVIQVNAENCI